MPPPGTRRRCRRHDLVPAAGRPGAAQLVCRTCGATATFIPMLQGQPATDTQAAPARDLHTCDDQPAHPCQACRHGPTQQGPLRHEIP